MALYHGKNLVFFKKLFDKVPGKELDYAGHTTLDACWSSSAVDPCPNHCQDMSACCKFCADFPMFPWGYLQQDKRL